MYYFYRYAPFVIFAIVVGGYGFGMEQMGYSFGTEHGKSLKVREYIALQKQCSKSPILSTIDFKKRVSPACDSFTMYSFYYDAVLANCVWNEMTR